MTQYTDQSGNVYTLDAELGKGGEGTVYRVGRSDVAKIYKNPSGETEKKLRLMLKHSDWVLGRIDCLAWPKAILYENRRFCGYIMPKLDADKSLDEVYEYPPHKSLIIRNRQKIKIASNLCAVVDEVHRHKLVFGDFNPENIRVSTKTGIVSFLDTDSYHLIESATNETYRCTVIAPGYAAPEILEAAKIYARSNGGENVYARMPLPTFTQASDRFALAIHVFKLLQNGASPYDGVLNVSHGSTASPAPGDEAVRLDSYIFKTGYSFRSGSPVVPLETFPQPIADLFTQAFIDGRKDPNRRPSAGQRWTGFPRQKKGGE